MIASTLPSPARRPLTGPVATCICVVLGAALYLASGMHLAGRMSATSDEVPHIGAGVTYLRGDLRLNLEHPPLTKWLAALNLPERDPPLRLSSEEAPIEVQWGFGSAWLHLAKQPPLYLLKLARTPLLLLNALLLPCVAALAYAFAGPLAACVSVLLAALCPLWLAHATLVTTDAAATLFCFAATALGVWLLGAPRRRRPMLAGAIALCLALALASKYSMLVAGPLIALGVGIGAWRSGERAVIGWIAGAVAGGTALGLAFAWGFPPRPEQYLLGVQRVGANHRADAVYYAFGELFQGNDPLYFARALLVKVSLPVWVLAIVAVVDWLLRAPREPRPAVWPLLVVPLGYYAVMASNAPAFGVRYVLPVLPFLLVLAGAGAARVAQLRAAPLWIALLLSGQAAGYTSALRATPLGFFNGFFCFTGEALPCLDDSNLDWGQALPELARYHAEHYPGVPLRVMYKGSAPVEAYVRNATVADLDEMTRPVPALYAISLHYRVRSPEGDWTRKLQPLAIVAGVYAIYDLRGLAQR
jgi:hypothetical protein